MFSKFSRSGSLHGPLRDMLNLVIEFPFAKHLRRLNVGSGTTSSSYLLIRLHRTLRCEWPSLKRSLLESQREVIRKHLTLKLILTIFLQWYSEKYEWFCTVSSDPELNLASYYQLKTHGNERKIIGRCRECTAKAASPCTPNPVINN